MDETSDAFMPKYKFRLELRAPHFDPTMHAFMIVQTVDTENM